MNVKQRKRERFNFRLSAAEAAVIKQAAALLDCSEAEFVRRAAMDAAERELGIAGVSESEPVSVPVGLTGTWRMQPHQQQAVPC